MVLVRQWVAALTLVPEDQREGIVRAVEKQIVDEFVERVCEVGNLLIALLVVSPTTIDYGI